MADHATHKPPLWKREDKVLYQDERGAVELINGSRGATIVVYNHLSDGVRIRKYPLAELLEDDHA
jgi:hypothetical protein